MSYDDDIARDARLYILQELARQRDGRLSELSIRRVLDVYGIVRDRDWITLQLRKLASLGAVELTQADTVQVARVTRVGRDHLEERIALPGVTAPADVE